jgi:hypothetical protein
MVLHSLFDAGEISADEVGRQCVANTERVGSAA